MGFMLGNLTVQQIQDRCGITLSEDEIKFLENTRQTSANNIVPDKWHCFDLPFTLLCGSKELQDKILEIFMPHSNEIKTQFMIAIET